MKVNWNLDSTELDNFVFNHKNSHYAKTSKWANVKKFQENYNAVYSGLYDDNQLIATACLLIKRKWGIRYAYIPWGICIDYDNHHALEIYCRELKAYAKQNYIAFIKMEVNLPRLNNQDCIDFLNTQGFIHKGYGYGYDGSWNNRYTLIIDIEPDMKTIKSNFTSPRKSALKKHNVYSIHTEICDTSRLDTLCKLEQILADEKGFKAHKPEFFANIMNNFPNNHIYAISTLYIDESLEKLEIEINSKKYAKDPEAKLAKQKSIDNLLVLKKKYGTKVEIAAGLFLFDQQSSSDLYLYKCSDFNFINGTDEIHQFMIEQMKTRGIKHYDMCGFSGSTESTDPYYGLYLYKSSFGSQIVEYVGEFNLVLNPRLKQIFDKTDRLYRKIRRKINYIKNKK